MTLPNASSNYIEQVTEFHRTFHHPVPDAPAIPSESRCALRVTLIAEELEELKESIEQKDIVAIADALCDLQYVLSGAIIEFGLKDKFNALFAEVQRSNMSKACATEQEALDTAEAYRKKDGTECMIQQDGSHWLVFRKTDRKTLKSIRYSPPDLQKILS